MVALSPRAYKVQMISGVVSAVLVLLVLIVYPRVTQKPATLLQSIQEQGHIRFLTLNSASTYYHDINQENGFEFELGQLFAESIGVKTRFIAVSQFSDLYPELLFGTGDIAAAGLSRNESSFSNAVLYGPAYYEVTNQILFRKGNIERPRKIEDLVGGTLKVISGSSQAKLLHELQRKHTDLAWIESDDIANEELIEQVESGKIDYALTDSHEIALQRRFFPELRVGFEMDRPKQLRWAFNYSDDNSLTLAIEDFFNAIKKDGRLDQLVHRHYSHVTRFNYSDIQTLTLHMRQRLPGYEALFKLAAKAHGIDWRLLAAIGYQESLWRPRAISPTGVRGLMMLTRPTAKQMGVKDRLNPEQSIFGGAKYFASVLKRTSSHIAEPDRTWFALASYNVGYGHLQDARKITKSNGGDPDKWIDVKKSLPLLARKKWYKSTKYGYARGWEPVIYVENIRKYYDYMVASDIKAQSGQFAREMQIESPLKPIAPSH
jgi:membrane-bound lytic murein transglycosylase F